MTDITYRVTIKKVYKKTTKYDAWFDEKELSAAGLAPTKGGGGRYIQKEKIEDVNEEIYDQAVVNLDVSSLIVKINSKS